MKEPVYGTAIWVECCDQIKLQDGTLAPSTCRRMPFYTLRGAVLSQTLVLS